MRNLFIISSLLLFAITGASAQLLHYSAIPRHNDTAGRALWEKPSHHSCVSPFYVEEYVTPKVEDTSALAVMKRKIDSINNESDDYIYIGGIAGAMPGVSPGVSSKNGFGEYSLGVKSDLVYSSKRNKKNLLAFSYTFIFNQSRFPGYIRSYTAKTRVVPGQGYARPAKWGYRYNDISFYLAKNAGRYFVFETGMGKNFWGDGHRSLFLSDVAPSYPYLKITTTIWRLKYVNLWANFKDITQGYDKWFNAENKYGAFHFLSWNATKRLNLNFFEAVVWKAKTEGHTRGFDVNYINPVIFYRPVEFSLGSPDNMLMGFGTHYNIGKKHRVYGQLLLDEFLIKEVKAGFSHLINPGDSTIKYGSWFNKQGFQLGYKYFDVAGIKNLNFQTEYNYVRPYTYSHREVSENYGHFNQPLAHILGANFSESVSLLRYTHKKWYFEAEFLHYFTGLDSNNSHFGQDIFKPTFDSPDGGNIVVNQYGNRVGQGIKTNVNFISLKTSYLMFPSINLRIEAEYIYRTQKPAVSGQSTNYFSLGFRTTMDRLIRDF